MGGLLGSQRIPETALSLCPWHWPSPTYRFCDANILTTCELHLRKPYETT